MVGPRLTRGAFPWITAMAGEYQIAELSSIQQPKTASPGQAGRSRYK